MKQRRRRSTGWSLGGRSSILAVACAIAPATALARSDNGRLLGPGSEGLVPPRAALDSARGPERSSPDRIVTKDAWRGARSSDETEPESIGARYSAFFLESLYGTENVAVAIDASGMRHIAFSEWNGDAVFYGTCRSGCDREANWQYVSIFDSGVEFGYEPTDVQIALDRRGRPRIAFEVEGYGTASEGYFYAECNAACMSRGGWQVVNFAEAGVSTLGSSEWFTIADDDRVHAVILRSQENQLLDQLVYIDYVVCDGDCTSASSWRRQELFFLGNLGFLAPSVDMSFAVDALGATRLALFVRFDGGHGALYFECSTSCEDTAGWGWLDATGAWGPALALSLDGSGRPHLATYNGQSIRYLWCEEDCLSTRGWQHLDFTNLPARAGQEGVGFTRDVRGHPYIGYANGASTGYLRCTSGCEQPGSSVWENHPVESASFPRYPQLPGCVHPVDQGWVLSGPMALAVAPDGSVSLGYTAANIQTSYCLDDNRVAEVAIRKARIAFSTGGSEGSGSEDAGVGSRDAGPAPDAAFVGDADVRADAAPLRDAGSGAAADVAFPADGSARRDHDRSDGDGCTCGAPLPGGGPPWWALGLGFPLVSWLIRRPRSPTDRGQSSSDREAASVVERPGSGQAVERSSP